MNGWIDVQTDSQMDGHAESHRSGLRKTSNKSPLSSKSKSFFANNHKAIEKRKLKPKQKKMYPS